MKFEEILFRAELAALARNRLRKRELLEKEMRNRGRWET